MVKFAGDALLAIWPVEDEWQRLGTGDRGRLFVRRSVVVDQGLEGERSGAGR